MLNLKAKVIFVFTLMMIVAVVLPAQVGTTEAVKPANYTVRDSIGVHVGTKNNPLLIESLANLRWMSEVPIPSEHWYRYDRTAEEVIYVHFRLTTDIDASETRLWNDGKGFIPIGYRIQEEQDIKYLFYGEFDGYEHTISNLYINADLYGGLFNETRGVTVNEKTKKTVIKDLVLENVEVKAIRAGGLIGHSQTTIIENVKVTGEINASATDEIWTTFAGGIVAEAYETDIDKSSAYVSVTTNPTLDSTANSVIYLNPDIDETRSLVLNISGGLAGYINNGKVTESYSIGDVTGNWAGGLFGNMYSIHLTKSYSEGNVTGGDRAGGLTAFGLDSIISDFYASNGVVKGFYAGGIGGFMMGSTISNSFSDMNLENTVVAGGLLGYGVSTVAQYNFYNGNIVSSGPNSRVGGLLGWTRDSYIENNFSSAHLTGDIYGGLAGFSGGTLFINNLYFGNAVGIGGGIVGVIEQRDSAQTRIRNSLWNGDNLSGVNYVSENLESGTVIEGTSAKTTAELKLQSTFEDIGWNFANVWILDPGINNGFPHLQIPVPLPPYPASLRTPAANAINQSPDIAFLIDLVLDDNAIIEGLRFYLTSLHSEEDDSPIWGDPIVIEDVDFTDTDTDTNTFTFTIRPNNRLENDTKYSWRVIVYNEYGDSRPNITNSFRTQISLSDGEKNLEITNRLIGNYPNPFNPSTTISFEIIEDNAVSIEIFNIRGQKIRALLNEDLEKGQHTIIWNGKGDDGNNVASGIYFYRMSIGDFNTTKRMLLMK